VRELSVQEWPIAGYRCSIAASTRRMEDSDFNELDLRTMLHTMVVCEIHTIVNAETAAS
jgi:hypothetical protein